MRARYQVENTLGILPGRATFVIDRSGAQAHGRLQDAADIEALEEIKRLLQ